MIEKPILVAHGLVGSYNCAVQPAIEESPRSGKKDSTDKLSSPLQGKMAPITTSTSSAILAAIIEAKQTFHDHIYSLSLGSSFARLPAHFLRTMPALWRLRGVVNWRVYEDITKTHRKYGRISRVVPDKVAIADPWRSKLSGSQHRVYQSILPLRTQ